MPGIYVGGHQQATAEVATGGLQQVGGAQRGAGSRAWGLAASVAVRGLRDGGFGRPTALLHPWCQLLPSSADPPLQNEFRFFAGCIAWEPGQLQREIAEGAWYTAACRWAGPGRLCVACFGGLCALLPAIPHSSGP